MKMLTSSFWRGIAFSALVLLTISCEKKENTKGGPIKIVSPKSINKSNASSYSFGGTCEGNNAKVSYEIEGFTKNSSVECRNKAWRVSGLDLSLLKDGYVTIKASVSEHTTSAQITKDTISPTITADFSTPVEATYDEGNVLYFQLTFSEEVVVTGSPRLVLDIGEDGSTSAAYAVYQNSSAGTFVTFAYTVAQGQNDFDDIEVREHMELDGGSVRDAHGNDALLSSLPFPRALRNVYIDTNNPSVTGLGHDFAVAQTKTWSWACSRNPCTYRFVINTSSSHSFDDTDDFHPIQAGAQLSGNGTYYLHVQAKDSRDRLSSISSVSVLLDNVAPSLSTDPIVIPPDAIYYAGGFLDFEVTYNENVVVTGVPRLTLQIGENGTTAVTKYATYLSGSGTSTLSFRYTVASGDEDADGLEMETTIDLDSGAITDASGNAAPLSSLTLPVLTGIYIDTSRRNVTEFAKEGLGPILKKEKSPLTKAGFLEENCALPSLENDLIAMAMVCAP
ncbi:MAG: hypothetical protein OXB88_07245 [Bacteriovoracales bacterium]|nr:hypothetical protein [Bacteriovoracales bacterium]